MYKIKLENKLMKKEKKKMGKNWEKRKRKKNI